MGSWFSNLHIRKSETVTAESIQISINQMMAQRNFFPAGTAEEADATVAVIDIPGGSWISLCSELLCHESPASCLAFAQPISAGLHTDVLGISCFDSDYLYLNLVNTEEALDAWLGIGSGSAAGIKRRSGLSAWKTKVSNYPAFSAATKETYIFAEEFLRNVEACLSLPMLQSMVSPDCIEESEYRGAVTYLSFQQKEDPSCKELPRLRQWTVSGLPCQGDRTTSVAVRNEGGRGKGLSVFFVGPYVENEEIKMEKVSLIKWVKDRPVRTPITLSKVQLLDGQYAYYHHDPEYMLLPKASDRAPMLKQRACCVEIEFTPVGNPRKMLDITVVFVPDQNTEGQTGWNPWYAFGSKKEFIKKHNQLEKRILASPNAPKGGCTLLREEDFD